MSDNCKKFINDVHTGYTQYPSTLDDYYNIVVQIGDEKVITISYKIIKSYYDGYIKSGVARDTMISRAIYKISEIVNDSR